MADLVAIAVIVLVVGAALGYIIKSKRRGVKCIGCPAGASCPSAKRDGGCSCNCNK